MQLLVNLTSNALRLTKEGFVRVQISEAPAREGEQRALDVKVMDTGPGIPASKIDALFKKYEQINTSSGGSGLGVSELL